MRRISAADLLELLGSMRFAISLLMFICVASIIGTVLAQNQPMNIYIDQFGPFWVDVFDRFTIWSIYNNWWFLLIMSFLVVSTTICVVRNAPKMLKDSGSFREYVRGTSLRAFPHRVEVKNANSCAQNADHVQQWLRSNGYKYKVRHDDDGSLMVAAKKGSANRLGYIFGHVAIVVICIGGLMDSELPIKLQMWLGGKTPITDNMLISEVPPEGRLSLANPSFRANMLVPEGARTATAVVSADDGVLVQPMPFVLELKRFLIEYYSTGMPSSFKSEVRITDPESGESFDRLIEVNEPLRYKGVTVYQSGFDDGGSTLELAAYPLKGARSEAFAISGKVGERTTFATDDQGSEVSVNFTELRIINVEDLSSGEPQPKAMIEHVAAVTGSAAGAKNENLKNVGPSVHYQLTGNDGQSREYANYMLPIELDGFPVFLVGMRVSPNDGFRYVRIPADENHSMDEFMRLRAALTDPELVNQAALRFVERNGNTEQSSLLHKAAQNALWAFANEGFNGLVKRVPEAEREKILSFTVPMIQLSLLELRELLREQAGESAVIYEGEQGLRAQEWVQLSVLALANLPEYPAPVMLNLRSFDHVQASVFQVSRSPGMYIVYTGSLFLVIGVFTMFYVRDRRIWVWIRNDGSPGTSMMAAMTSQRRNLDFNREFDHFKQSFQRLSA
ncbi:cytochrome c biogenesis protein ResB [Paenalcaligenes niemegkensis]|uniref:cytochrome c biogenesis protein ResB n=1 Tax=Paenalcaligenes niemegkensis TaxID=2895469 RepID=UPI001EE7969A|nr:cytochrome c biogenesis protein ResB [Paenalcaligenes niemegkensis]MCQ9617766.1 cytochrome c biogenesis protein ResB [Paenalcaligenes niemegkensis]